MDERTLNDLLECSVCLERLDTSSKVLPCQHTFCRKCLEVILSSRQELRCPECRILVETKIDDLPPNVLLMRILEGMKNTAAAAKSLQQQQQPESPIIQNDNKIENTLKSNEEQQQQIKLKQQQFFYYQQQQNKQKQQIHLQALHHQQQQQQQNQHQQQKQLQQNDTINAATNVVTATGATSTAAVAAPAPHQRRVVPHAYALYDFDSNDPSDLHFKKGDVILLKRKVDINWFVGELNGVGGTFPTNYVQVIVPLPSPQCIALYDFKMGPNEEEGCLIFKKGTLINVLRRVDHNWAEGRIGSMIGIFPIAFVELNPLAKQLLDSLVVLKSQPPPPIAGQQPQQQKQLHQQQLQHQQQNTPSQISANQHNSTANNINNLQQQTRNLSPIPVATAKANDMNTADASKTPDTPTSSTSSSSSSQTSPNFNSNTSCSSTSTSLPSSPNQSNPTSPHNSSNVRYRDCKEKRHSLNALLSQASGGVASSSGPLLSIVQSANRHSAEILSVPSDLSTVQNIRMRSANDVSLAGSSKPTTTNTAASSASPSCEQQQAMPSVVAATPRANVLKTAGQQIVPPTLPWGYLALYPYKPRKSDELELKKGCVYVVTERCLDGWFKGKNWQDIAGVFPGNYVTPLRNRDQQQLMHQWKYVQSQPPIQQQLPLSATQTKHATTVAATTCSVLHQPPDLPPRHSPSSSPIAPPSSSINCSSSVWSKPLGQTVEAFFSRRSHNSQNDQHEVVGGGGGGNGKDKDREKQKDNNVAASTSGCSGSASSAAVNLMKRLTHIKNRSKSPNNNAANAAAASIQQPTTATATTTTYSMDNPSFEDSSVALGTTAHTNQPSLAINNHPVHVRSGSCPSQLLQSLPVDLHSSSTNNEASSQAQQPHGKQQIPPQDTYSGGSQRIKGCKERSQILTNGRPTADVAIRGVFNNGAVQQLQQQQQQKKYTKCSQQAQQQQQQLPPCSINNSSAIHHRKSQSLDANIMSAQTPSPVPNARESRFRCVVSYPPNSEHELDLRVGDVVYVHRKQKNGWYKGTHARTNKTGLFPASFVEPDI